MGDGESHAATQRLVDLYADLRASAFADESAVARSARDAAIERFAKTGFPHRRQEAWKYTNLAPMYRTAFSMDSSAREIARDLIEPYFLNDGVRLVFVNGLFSESLSQPTTTTQGVSVTLMGSSTTDDDESDTLERSAERDPLPLAFLNRALGAGGAVISVAPGAQIVDAIQLIFVATADAGAVVSLPRVKVDGGENSSVAVVENHLGLAGAPTLAIPVTEIRARPGAHVDHVRTAELAAGAFHLGAIAIVQEQNSRAESCVVTTGGEIARHDYRVSLDGADADCNVRGLAMLDGSSHVDHHLFVRHAAPNCRSREFFKNVLDDSSRGVFCGRIYVDQDAQKTDGVQTNAALLLSDNAKTESRPQLEIYADDVKCTHGATIGQLDENAIFYLQARGVPEDVARTMLIQGFAGEILDEIRIEGLRDRLKDHAFAAMAQKRQTLQPAV